MTPLAADVMVAYAARDRRSRPGLGAAAGAVRRLRLWQRELLGDEDDPTALAARQIAYWQASTRRSAGADRAAHRPAAARRAPSNRGGTVRLALGGDIHRRLLDWRAPHRRHACSWSSTPRSRRSCPGSAPAPDIAIGTPVAGRGERGARRPGRHVRQHPGAAHRRAPGSRSPNCSSRSGDADLDAFSHVDVPFERLVEALNPTRSTARHPLFQVVLALQNTADPDTRTAGTGGRGARDRIADRQVRPQLRARRTPRRGGHPTGLDVELGYAKDLFDEDTALRIGEPSSGS